MTSRRTGDAMILIGCKVLIRNFTTASRPTLARPSYCPINRGPIKTKRIRQHRFVSQISGQKQLLVENEHRSGTLVDQRDIVEPEKNEKKKLPEKGQPSIIPWYLRVELPQFPEEQIPKRQRIPELPESPPPILEPLLNQISVNLGLDYLSILDLRKVDPPPSLGANLLMLIATARSEKHLQVSADRLCRWLRTEYKLRPDADGLLGRNELRTRLKRKANRAKLMGRNFENNDDGIRSGWVCVDAGIVDIGQVKAQEAVSPKDFVGFGRQAEGTRIVIQLLTAEKREEIDLESLWTQVLNPGVQRNFNDNGFLEEDEVQKKPVNTTDFCRKDVFSTAGQIRKFHKSARILSGARDHSDPTYSRSSDFSSDISLIQENLMAILKAGKFNEATRELLENRSDNPRLKNEGWRLILLEALLRYLKDLPKEEALIQLGTGFSDYDSTPFLNCYYQTLSMFSFEAQSEIHIEFTCYAHNIKHNGYTLESLTTLHKKLALDGVKISRKSYMQILESIFSSTNPQMITKYAVKILSNMHDRGFDILNEETLVKLQLLVCQNEAFQDISETINGQKSFLSFPRFRSFSTFGSHGSFSSFTLPSSTIPKIIERLHLLMMNIKLPMLSDESRILLLKNYAKRGYWIEFWEIFRLASSQGLPQGENIFTHMFALVAETRNQRASRLVLRAWFPEMVRELPNFPTNNRELVEAIQACLLLSDPQLLQETDSGQLRESEFTSMWRRCLGK
ncbi:ATPase synthesis protein 25, mitochondrial [Golovinomyces cichoracearum]|uniref:ATPase synthesis protein 25 n=1 Tax=Golovinomyces cichoracearum TaxID=62708 RepID=A0A420I4R1_9PEZI|nr:ATPase synthesis protein 25, mitochondrial [Golovinomyces cichoracearum]